MIPLMPSPSCFAPQPPPEPADLETNPSGPLGRAVDATSTGRRDARRSRSGSAGASALKIVSTTVIGIVIHIRMAAGFVALTTRPAEHDLQRTERAVVDRHLAGW